MMGPLTLASEKHSACEKTNRNKKKVGIVGRNMGQRGSVLSFWGVVRGINKQSYQYLITGGTFGADDDN